MNKKSLLDKINNPSDLKNFSLCELKQLSTEIREFLIHNVSQTGGHLASNLGIVELSIALHYVFDSPKDKFIFDIGHQSYVHKILTGRKNFHTLRQKNGLSGFTRRHESAHDILNSGHASNSISIGLGILVAQELQTIKSKVICIIGDAGLSGGLALAGLNNAGRLNKNLIIIVNDNTMSISKNVGALHDYLSRLTATKEYHGMKRFLDSIILSLPFIGKLLTKIIFRIKRSIKAMFFKQTLFCDLGFEYVGPLHGHQLSDLITVLKNAAAINRPIVVHVVTEKGRGYLPATMDPVKYHTVVPFSQDQKVTPEKKDESLKTFTQIASETLVALAKKDKSIVTITAAMPTGTGLSEFAKQYPSRFFDVGIAEDHAVSFAAGLALAGMKPVVAIYSTFFQRAVDQVIHDIAIQGMLRVVFLLDRAGFVPNDGENHHGLYDLAIYRGIPNLNILAPASQQELQLMISWAFIQNYSTIIRYPKDIAPIIFNNPCQPIHLGEGVFEQRYPNSKTLLISVGSMVIHTMEASSILYTEHTIHCDVYNLRFIVPISQDILLNIIKDYKFIIVIEEGAKNAGVGEFLAQLCLRVRPCPIFKNIAVDPLFFSIGTRSELLKISGLTTENIIDTVLKNSK